MNVVHVITRLIIGGAQENTLHTVEDQHQLHGDRVTLITGPAIGPEGSLIPRAESGGFRLIKMPEMIRSLSPHSDYQAYRELLRHFKELKPDLVHTHSSKAGILGRAAAYKLKIPVVHTIHGASFHYGQSMLAYRGYIAAEKWAARWTNKFISVADDMSAAYVQAGIAKADQFVTIRSGFDVEPFLQPPRTRAEVRSELGFSDADVVIGKVARLFNLKGHEYLIRAAKRVVDTCPQTMFLLVGDGILREKLEQQIAELNLQRNFRFTGLVPPSQIPELMGAMDIVAHTSQWEGLARVLPQGLISGLPVISYDVGGAREVVINHETGYLLPRDSVEELSTAMIELINDPVKRKLFGSIGRERCRKTFDHKYMTARIREVYADVLISNSTQVNVSHARG